MLHRCATNKKEQVEIEAIVVEETTVGKDLKIEVAKVVEAGHQVDITQGVRKEVRVETDSDLIAEEIELRIEEIEAGKGHAR